jgi:hypothetical protein
MRTSCSGLSSLELGAADAGTSRGALDAYREGIVRVLANVVRALRSGGARPDRRERPSRPLPGDPRARRLVLDDRRRRHVNRRTGRRAGEFYEDVLVTRAT